MTQGSHRYSGPYTGRNLDHIAFPLGGIGAGMVCLEGTGALSHVSVRHRPEIQHQPLMFSALWVDGAPTARVLEGSVPTWKRFGPPGTGNGGRDSTYGLPHFRRASFRATFPFAEVALEDTDMPVTATITGWSPFIPGNADDSSLPLAALEIALTNADDTHPRRGVYSFHARNFLKAAQEPGAEVKAVPGGFAMIQAGPDAEPHRQGEFRAWVDGGEARSDCAWFRGGWFDALTMLWKKVQRGGAEATAEHGSGAPSPGGSLYVPFELAPGETTTIRLCLCWYVPHSDVRLGPDLDPEEGRCGSKTYEPWYAGAFTGAEAVALYWEEHAQRLREASERFSTAFYDTDLPPEVIEAVAANLTILKSPTCLRQRDGRFWAWEGCCDERGCCHGTCTHVWNYAQALPHLFPELERSLRHTEFHESQDESGHQTFRASLPIRPSEHTFHAAGDGQLGGIMKVYREWRVSADLDWLRELWPRLRHSLDYCIETWDPERRGVLREPHHNTYDIEFWGPDSMCSSFYLGALRAATLMGQALGDEVQEYQALYERGRDLLEERLFNGDYFVQDVTWKGLRAPDPSDPEHASEDRPAEALQILQEEGPKYQVGDGCLSDGVLGVWIAVVCGLDEEILDDRKVRSHLLAVHRHNLRPDLSNHSNPQRPTYAVGSEGGLLLCSWPQGNEPSLPFVYSNEVWTGIEYQVAAHLMWAGCVNEALQIVRTCRDRYDGSVRNPFDEYECGHWYARAMSSYGMLQCLTGTRYDAVTRTLHVAPRLRGEWRAFLCTANGYATVGVRGEEPFLDVVSGTIEVDHVEYTPYTES